MRISAIVAMSENHVIGKDNKLPWHLPADLQHFKKVTLGYPIIMGRKTYESIGKPLPGRTNIVITRDISFSAPGCDVVYSLSEALQRCEKKEEVFIIGGAEIFKSALSIIQRLYLTVIHEKFSGDVFFPALDFSQWKLIEKVDHSADANNQYNYSFKIYERISD